MSVHPDRATRHRQAAETHDGAADRHEKAAAFWAERGNTTRRTLELRNVKIERDPAQLERDRAYVEEADPLGADESGASR